ncbi:MAG: TonB family protein [Acidobacteria bacterium]|nr:TonB family protein [Acidobacteriota bacterium]
MNCQELQALMCDENGSVTQLDGPQKAHLDQCEHCQQFLASISELSQLLAEDAGLSPSDQLVVETLIRVAQDKRKKERTFTPWFWLTSAAAMIALAVSFAPKFAHEVGQADMVAAKRDAQLEYFERELPAAEAPMVDKLEADPEELPATTENVVGYEMDRQVGDVLKEQVRNEMPKPAGGFDGDEEQRGMGAKEDPRRKNAPAKQKVGKDGLLDRVEETKPVSTPAEVGLRSDDGPAFRDEKKREIAETIGRVSEIELIPPKVVKRVSPNYPKQAPPLEGDVVLRVVVRRDGMVQVLNVVDSFDYDHGFIEAAEEAVQQWEFKPATSLGQPTDMETDITITFSQSEPNGPKGAWFHQLDQIQGLEFHPSHGRWANTYLPGNPRFRYLDWLWQQSPLWSQLSMEPVVPRLDVPTRQALALSLSSNRSSADGPKRALVQVAIKAAAFGTGRRPPMNITLLLHVNSYLSTADRQLIADVIDHLAAVKAPEDVIRLQTTRDPGRDQVEAFRHGPLQVAKKELLFQPQSGQATEALIAAVNGLCGEASESTQNTVLFLTNQGLSDLDDLCRVSEFAVLNGVQVSVINVGAAYGAHQGLALAGHGLLHDISEPAQARDAVQDELDAASRTVARALRLVLKLAPGVRLVDVIGSRSLDERESEVVAAAEHTLDRRLSAELGIPSDRDQDDQGVVIVIPAFLAGDTHTVLLDVVVPGQGPVVEATLRYKDLIWTRNTTLRHQLTLPGLQRSETPEQLLVMRQWLVTQTQDTLRRAYQWMNTGNHERAIQLLQAHCRLLSDYQDHLQVPDPGIEQLSLTLSTLANWISDPQVASNALQYAALALTQRPQTL